MRDDLYCQFCTVKCENVQCKLTPRINSGLYTTTLAGDCNIRVQSVLSYGYKNIVMKARMEYKDGNLLENFKKYTILKENVKAWKLVK